MANMLVMFMHRSQPLYGFHGQKSPWSRRQGGANGAAGPGRGAGRESEAPRPGGEPAAQGLRRGRPRRGPRWRGPTAVPVRGGSRSTALVAPSPRPALMVPYAPHSGEGTMYWTVVPC